MSDQATARPWKRDPENTNIPCSIPQVGTIDANIDGYSFHIALVFADGPWREKREEAEANAELIVRAVNAHDALIEALSGLLCSVCGNRIGYSGAPTVTEHRPIRYDQCSCCKQAREALKLAGSAE